MRNIVGLLLLLVTAGCSWQQPMDRVAGTAAPVLLPPRAGNDAAGADTRGLVAATVAQQQLGVDYRYGGATPAGFDCSGLVHYAYAQAGVQVPRTTDGLWRQAREVDDGEPRPGDLLFFNFGGKPSHVGIYVGDRYFVHAPSTGKRVTTVHMSDAFYAARLRRIARLPL